MKIIINKKCPYCETQMIKQHAVKGYPYIWCSCSKCNHWSLIKRKKRE